MSPVKTTKTTWKAKVGGDVMRIMILQGSHSPRKVGFIPAIIARFEGPTGGKLLAPPQRFEESHDDWDARVAALYHDLDKDWSVEAESVTWPDDEKTLRRTVGRLGLAVLENDAVGFLDSTFPIRVAKEVYRTRDGMRTIRVLQMSPSNDKSMFVVANKLAGRAETIDGGWLGTAEGSEAHELSSMYFNSGERKVGEWSSADLYDEASFQAWLGPVILSWMPKAYYARFVRGGDNSNVTGSEFWGDGFDHGGVGLPPPPSPALNGTVPIDVVATPRGAAAPTGAPPRRKDGKPPVPSIDRVCEAETLRDDPAFGSF